MGFSSKNRIGPGNNSWYQFHFTHRSSYKQLLWNLSISIVELLIAFSRINTIRHATVAGRDSDTEKSLQLFISDKLATITRRQRSHARLVYIKLIITYQRWWNYAHYTRRMTKSREHWQCWNTEYYDWNHGVTSKSTYFYWKKFRYNWVITLISYLHYLLLIS